MYLYNSLTRKIEKFHPLKPPQVSLYTCGPTVYDYTHIGHLRTYVNHDLLKRTLIYLGYQVKHVMNITDVGHLTGDDDSGEDKLEKGAKKEKKTVWEIARFYTNHFFKSINQVNILKPEIICRATDHIKEMIDLIKILEKKGFVYQTQEALYFNTKKLKNYGKLNLQKEGKKIAGREEIHIDPEKKNPQDFALWFKKVNRFKDHHMSWSSPWGKGFPGWHIECSAMSIKYLGKTIDIHAGGIEHIPIHHTNEIAQSEAATGKKFVNFWVHHNHLLVDGKKMSKSLNNFYTIDDLIKKRFHPGSLRYFYLQSHYRQSLNFTWEALKGSENALKKLSQTIIQIKKKKEKSKNDQKEKKTVLSFENAFKKIISNDLQIPQALSLLWEMIKSNLSNQNKIKLFEKFNQIFGLKIISEEIAIPKEVYALAKKREEARMKKDFKLADEIRKKINNLGFNIEDKKSGFQINPKNNP